MEMPAKAGQEYWRRVLAAGGSTVIPRWTLDPVTGVGECMVALPGHAVSSGPALLAAHAVVLAALSGERDVVTGYVATGGQVLPCRLTTEAGPWRSLVAEAAGRRASCCATPRWRSRTCDARWGWRGRRSRRCSTTTGTAT